MRIQKWLWNAWVVFLWILGIAYAIFFVWTAYVLVSWLVTWAGSN